MSLFMNVLSKMNILTTCLPYFMVKWRIFVNMQILFPRVCYLFFSLKIFHFVYSKCQWIFYHISHKFLVVFFSLICTVQWVVNSRVSRIIKSILCVNKQIDTTDENHSWYRNIEVNEKRRIQFQLKIASKMRTKLE